MPGAHARKASDRLPIVAIRIFVWKRHAASAAGIPDLRAHAVELCGRAEGGSLPSPVFYGDGGPRPGLARHHRNRATARPTIPVMAVTLT
jgi:hypothetical protein